MKKLLLGSVALIVMSAPVLAADMPVKVKPLPPAWSWTGCYVGLNVGYGWARFRKSNVTAVGIPPSFRQHLVRRFRFRRRRRGRRRPDRLQLAERQWSSGASRPTSRSPASKPARTSTTDLQLPASRRLRYRRASPLCGISGPCADAWVGPSLRRPCSTSPAASPMAASSRRWPFRRGRGAHRVRQLRQPDPLRLHGGRRRAKPRSRRTSPPSSNTSTSISAARPTTSSIRTASTTDWDQRVDFHTVRLGLNYQFNWYETGGREILINRSAARKPRATPGAFSLRENHRKPRLR